MAKSIPVRTGGDLARAVRHLRRAEGLSQEQLAERLRLDVQVVRRFESGEATLYFERLLVTAAALGMTVTLVPR